MTYKYYSFEVDIVYNEDRVVHIPFKDVGQNYAIILSYGDNRVGFGKYKFNYALLLAILGSIVGIGIIIAVVIVINKRRAHSHSN